MRPLTARRALVTGATSGIGRSVARTLADGGAAVLATGRDPAALDRIRVEHRGIEAVAADLTRAEDQERLLDAAGDLDILVGDAGVGWVGQFADMPLEEIQRIIDLNFTATTLLVRRALPRLRRGGHLVLLSSALAWFSSPPLTVYSATKFAVHGLCRGLRRELIGHGIQVTEVAPGPVSSSFFPRAVSRPAAGTAPDLPMLDPDRVATAVRRALEHPRRPTSRTVPVPRAMGLTRLSELPGASALADLAGVAGRSRLLLRPGPADQSAR